MTKGEVLQSFFGRFLTAYPSTSVPVDVTFPYLTYEPIFDNFFGGEVGLTVNLWFYTTSEAIPNAKAQEIADAIGLGGTTLPCDGGYIWIKRGSPFSLSQSDADNDNVKLRSINVTVEFLTTN